MTLIIDNIAKTIMEWCDVSSPKLRNYAVDKEMNNLVKQDLYNYLKDNTIYNVLNEQPIYNSFDSVDLIINPLADNPTEKIVAEFIVENISEKTFEKEVSKDIDKLSATDNIKDDYKEATKCIISLYFNANNRDQLHDKNFIEIYNDLEIGCAMRKI